MRRSAVLPALLLLGGCVVGPKYAPPAQPAGLAAALPGAQSPVFAADAPPGEWWRLYDDPALDALVLKALSANTDLREATANLAQARALLSEARSARLPSTQLSAGAGYSRTAATPASPAFNTDFYQAGIDVAYELDLFGAVTSSIRSARASTEQAAAARDTVRILVAAETARAYADACSAAAQRAVAERSLKLQANTYDLTERQAQAGRGRPDDVQRARAQLETTRSTIPAYVAARANALARLAVLTGDPPALTPTAAAACEATPLLRNPLPIGDGTAMLARRPDVRAADRELAAATATVGVATAALYPTVTLGGSIGSFGGSPAQFARSDAVSFSVGPFVTWNFPNFAAVRAQIRQAEAAAEASLARFDGTVLAALQETETALNNYAGELDRNAALRRARDHNAEAVRVIELRYRYGAENFLNVLDAQRALAETEALLASSTALVADDQIAVFKALGGGWENAPAVARVAVPGTSLVSTGEPGAPR